MPELNFIESQLFASFSCTRKRRSELPGLNTTCTHVHLKVAAARSGEVPFRTMVFSCSLSSDFHGILLLGVMLGTDETASLK